MVPRPLLAGIIACLLIAPQLSLGATSGSSSSARAKIMSTRAQARAALRKATPAAKSRASSSAKSSSSSAKSNDGLVDIGVTLKKNALAVFIFAIESGSPAETAGLKVGDEIHKVGSMEVTRTSNMDTIAKNLRGISGSRVTVEYGRSQVGIKSVEIVRRWKNETAATLSSANKVEMRENVMILTVEDLTEAGVTAMQSAILDQKQSPSAVVIDLRKSPKGSLEGAAKFVGFFTARNTLLAWVQTPNTAPFSAGLEKLHTASDPLFSKEVRIAVLSPERMYPSLLMIVETMGRHTRGVQIYSSTLVFETTQSPVWTMKAPNGSAVEYPPVTLWAPTEDRLPYGCENNMAKNPCFRRAEATLVNGFLTNTDEAKDLDEVIRKVK